VSNRALRAALFLLFLSGFSFSQLAPQTAPLPYDPLELTTGPTVVPNTPEQRATVLNLLERARQNSAMHTPGTAPFNIKVSFNSVETRTAPAMVSWKKRGLMGRPGAGREDAAQPLATPEEG
jgi:hypothetical protein